MVVHFCFDDDVDVLEDLSVVHDSHLLIRPPYKNVVETVWRGVGAETSSFLQQKITGMPTSAAFV
jgi:hypothetical protein